MVTYVQLQQVCQVLLCLYGARHSYTAITNLQKYEATTKKLAEWSSEVERQLWKTRKTQAAGAITIFIALISSTALAFFPSHLHRYLQTALPASLLIGTVASRAYIKNFWTPTQKDKDGKPVGTKVPLPNFEDYNRAVQSTEMLLSTLQYLEYSTVASLVVQWFMISNQKV